MTDEDDGGWASVLGEMDELASDLDADGWTTLTIAAGDAAAVTPETGRADRHGYSYVVGADDATAFEEAFVPDGFPRTEVYRAETGTHLFVLTVLQDPPSEQAILLAGAFDTQRVRECERVASETGRMYTTVLAADGTLLGAFEHDDPAAFFPDAA